MILEVARTSGREDNSQGRDLDEDCVFWFISVFSRNFGIFLGFFLQENTEKKTEKHSSLRLTLIQVFTINITGSVLGLRLIETPTCSYFSTVRGGSGPVVVGRLLPTAHVSLRKGGPPTAQSLVYTASGPEGRATGSGSNNHASSYYGGP